MKNTLKLALIIPIIGLLFTSCEDDEQVKMKSRFDKGTFVLNEGSSHSTLSFLEYNVDSVANNVFEAVNGIPLGNFAQSIAFSDKYLLIAVTTSTTAGYVEVVDKETLVHQKSFTGFSYPREIAVNGNMAYISNGSGEGEVFIIDLETLTIKEKSIAVGKGPEKMLVANGKLYVANSGGFTNDDNTVSVVDLSDNTVVKTISVKDCPRDMVMDKDGAIWVYCGGVPEYSSDWQVIGIINSGISRIAADYSVQSFDIGKKSTSGIKNIAINKEGTTIYYVTDGVYQLDYKDVSLPASKFITPENKPYSIDINPSNGDVYLCEIADYVSPGSVVVYSKEGDKMDNYTVGVTPSACLFQ